MTDFSEIELRAHARGVNNGHCKVGCRPCQYAAYLDTIPPKHRGIITGLSAELAYPSGKET